MKKTLGVLTIGAAMALGTSGVLAQPKFQDVEMITLAQQSGCVACHTIAPAGKGPNGLKPIGPAWQDVAAKYKDVEGAEADLVQTVLKGSNPYSSHWKGDVSGIAMPPNAVAISQEDAGKLVSWILHLAD